MTKKLIGVMLLAKKFKAEKFSPQDILHIYTFRTIWDNKIILKLNIKITLQWLKHQSDYDIYQAYIVIALGYRH